MLRIFCDGDRGDPTMLLRSYRLPVIRTASGMLSLLMLGPRILPIVSDDLDSSQLL